MNDADSAHVTTRLCIRCKLSPRRISLGKSTQRYCLTCHAEMSKKWRSAHKLTDDQRRKSNARSYANTYQRRGRLVPQPCEVCGDKAQKHHDDYDKPLEVRWLCKRHHQKLHREVRA